MLRYILYVLVVLFLSGCAAVPSEETGPAGFWLGLWHGFIALFAFAVSLFNDSVGIYEANNKGGLYDLGFMLGIMMFWGGSGSASKRPVKRG